MAIPVEITASHIEQAFELLKNKKNLRKPTKYEVIYKGVRYPPKEVIRAAHKICFNSEIGMFSGGNESNNFLIRRGFKVVLIGTDEEISIRYSQKINENDMNISDEPLIDKELCELDDFELENTELNTIIKARLGHSLFKKRLYEVYKKCALCEIEQPELLIASHIKPWSESSNKERLDVYNGLLLCPNHDLLFDRGYITFNKHGQILLSTKLGEKTKIQLDLKSLKLDNLSEKSREYMEWHYSNIFKW